MSLKVFASVVLASLSVAVPANAAVTPNSCRYSIDTLYRDMPVNLTATATLVPDARYPAPTDVVPGTRLRTEGGTANVELPEYLARFGTALGLLHEGYNEVPVKVWIAVAASNTKERVQVVGPLDVTASTTITVDPADDNRFLSATPWEYTAPALGDLEWTAVGGDVVVAQAPAGSLPALPVGPGGANRPISGSVVIHATFNGGALLFMDCRPGVTTGIEFDFAGPTYDPRPAVPFASRPGPRNAMCLNSVGRLVSGAAANFPDGVDRELDPLPIALSTTGFEPKFATGHPYTLPATTLSAQLTGDTVATLGRFEEGGQPLLVPGTSYGVDAWVTIAASNTVEGVRTVRGQAAYTPGAALDPIALAVVLPATTWTPTGAGPVRFTLAPPGASGPAGARSPFGSVVLELGTERGPATLDCVAGAIRVVDPSVPWSDLGRAGPAGRYAIDANVDTPVFASAVDGAPPPPPPPPDPTPTPAPTAAPSPEPTATPVFKRPAGSVASTKLTTRRGRIQLRLACPAGSFTCTGRATVRSASRVKVGKRSKIVALTRSLRYSVAPGKRRTVSLSLSRDARTVLRRKRSLRVRVTLTTSQGVTATRRVLLRRG